jgi:hypothetical protein
VKPTNFLSVICFQTSWVCPFWANTHTHTSSTQVENHTIHTHNIPSTVRANKCNICHTIPYNTHTHTHTLHPPRSKIIQYTHITYLALYAPINATYATRYHTTHTHIMKTHHVLFSICLLCVFCLLLVFRGTEGFEPRMYGSEKIDSIGYVACCQPYFNPTPPGNNFNPTPPAEVHKPCQTHGCINPDRNPATFFSSICFRKLCPNSVFRF